MKRDAKEIGGQCIYGFQLRPGRTPWEQLSNETRAGYRARMQELINALTAADFEIVAAPKPKRADPATAKIKPRS